MRREDPALGIRHTHAYVREGNLARLQSAHDRLGWDVSKSRLVSFPACTVCGEIDRDSVEECAADGCVEHRACRRPYR